MFENRWKLTCTLKDFTFDMWDFLFSITETLSALRHSLICIRICCCFYSYVTYICAWTHIEWQKCIWQPWTVANSVLNCEIRLRTGFGGHKDTWADLHEDLLIAHGLTARCAFCRNVKASYFLSFRIDFNVDIHDNVPTQHCMSTVIAT